MIEAEIKIDKTKGSIREALMLTQEDVNPVVEFVTKAWFEAVSSNKIVMGKLIGDIVQTFISKPNQAILGLLTLGNLSGEHHNMQTMVKKLLSKDSLDELIKTNCGDENCPVHGKLNKKDKN